MSYNRPKNWKEMINYSKSRILNISRLLFVLAFTIMLGSFVLILAHHNGLASRLLLFAFYFLLGGAFFYIISILKNR